MSAKHYRVGEVARMANVTVRTLHHYDSIGLLRPSARSDAGYRLYTDADLLRLQQIHIGRALGLSLDRIGRMLDQPDFDLEHTLREQRAHLQARGREIATMIRTIDRTLASLAEKGPITMNPKKLFDGFDPAAYEDEARERWGHTDAYKESQRRTRGYSKEDWARIHEAESQVLTALADELARGTPATHERAMDLAEALRLHIDRWFYPCSHQQHAALAEMYLADPRFTAYYEERAPGLAQYVADAIRANAARTS